MPILSRRRWLVAGLPLAAAALVTILLLTAPDPMRAARAKYDRIQVGMTEEEVGAVLQGWSHQYSSGSGCCLSAVWFDPRTGVTITVGFCAPGGASDLQVTGKRLKEGDQSFHVRVERLKDRLAGRPRRVP